MLVDSNMHNLSSPLNSVDDLLFSSNQYQNHNLAYTSLFNHTNLDNLLIRGKELKNLDTSMLIKEEHRTSTFDSVKDSSFILHFFINVCYFDVNINLIKKHIIA